jgi:hypothetical protein
VNRAVAQVHDLAQDNATPTEQMSSTAPTLTAQPAELQALVACVRRGRTTGHAELPPPDAAGVNALRGWRMLSG